MSGGLQHHPGGLVGLQCPLGPEHLSDLVGQLAWGQLRAPLGVACQIQGQFHGEQPTLGGGKLHRHEGLAVGGQSHAGAKIQGARLFLDCHRQTRHKAGGILEGRGGSDLIDERIGHYSGKSGEPARR